MKNQLEFQINKNAEDYKAWLRYKRNPELQLNFINTILFIEEEEQSPVIQSAIKELMRGLTGISGVAPTVVHEQQDGNLIHLVRLEQAPEAILVNLKQNLIHNESYAIKLDKDNGNETLYVIGKTDKGILYGSFHLLRLLQMKEPVFDVIENPKNNLRMLNHWDNMDGSIERGYAGESIFYKNNQFVEDFDRIKDYARLLASVGINGVSINNVNVHKIETNLITPEYLPDVAKVAKVFRSYGIQLFLSVNYASSIELGGLDSADPLDHEVKEFWKKQAAVIYEYIPDFGGFIVKADSEHRPGPFTYDRNHAEGANMLAEALLPYNGLVIWRCFVYNCLQDWRDRETDRARAAYDHFKPLDGNFMDNVILQIKNGPMDFQVREAISPLFGAMPKTNQMLELQITQEYTGQQKDLFYLIPQWKEILDFETYAKGEGSTVKRIVDGSLFPYKNCGITAVVNVGNDQNWTGHPLAQANLYGYGRLTWDPDIAADEITFEWISQTYGHNRVVQDQIKQMLDDSGQIYENYTAPLGVGWMVNPHHHYGPNVDGYEYSVWGTYHFADLHGIGVDRTVKSGTGYTAQYFEENAKMYESLETCPDELLLFFHHVPYTHQLKSGETVIQHIYNTHFDGVEQAKGLIERWNQLEGKIDKKKYEDVLERLNIQVENAKEWRDIINTYFYRKSGIADELNRKIY